MFFFVCRKMRSLLLLWNNFLKIIVLKTERLYEREFLESDPFTLSNVRSELNFFTCQVPPTIQLLLSNSYLCTSSETCVVMWTAFFAKSTSRETNADRYKRILPFYAVTCLHDWLISLWLTGVCLSRHKESSTNFPSVHDHG